MKKLTKEQVRLIILGLIVGLFFLGSFFYMGSQAQQKRELVKTNLLGKTDNLEAIDLAIQQLFDTKDPNFLVKDVKKEQVAKLKKLMTKGIQFKETTLLPKMDYAAFNRRVKQVKKDYSKLEAAYETQTHINQLYETKGSQVAMNGPVLNQELPITDDLTQATVNEIKITYYKQDASTHYEQTVNEFIETAEKQVDQIKKAQEAVAKVYQDGQVVSTDSQLYSDAKTETNQIKNEKAKQALINQLELVNEASQQPVDHQKK